MGPRVKREPGLECTNGGEMSFRLREPSGIFTSELLAIFMALHWFKSEITTLVNSLFDRDSISSLRALQTQKIHARAHTLV
jgi:hypothetical protein